MLDINELYVAATNNQRSLFKCAIRRDCELKGAEWVDSALCFKGFGRNCKVYLSGDAIPEIVVEGKPTYTRKLAAFKSSFEDREYGILESIVREDERNDQIAALCSRHAGGPCENLKQSEFVEAGLEFFDALAEHLEGLDRAVIRAKLRAIYRRWVAAENPRLARIECDLDSDEEFANAQNELAEWVDGASEGQLDCDFASTKPSPVAIEKRVEKNEEIEEQIELEFSRQNCEQGWEWRDDDLVDVDLTPEEFDLAQVVAQKEHEAYAYRHIFRRVRFFASFRVARQVIRAAVTDLAEDRALETSGAIQSILRSHQVIHFDAREFGHLLSPFPKDSTSDQCYQAGCAFFGEWNEAEKFLWEPHLVEYIGAFVLSDDVSQSRWDLKARALLANAENPRYRNEDETKERLREAALQVAYDEAASWDDPEEREEIMSEFDSIRCDVESHDWD